MWVVYQKSDNVIVGASAETGQDPDKKSAIAETVKGLESPGALDQYDAVQVKERDRALKILDALMRKTVKVGENKGLMDVVEDDSTDVFLSVTVEGAQGTHPVDQVPLLQANPSSFVTIKLQKLDANGKPLTRKTVDKDVLYLRADHGFLRAEPASSGAVTSPGMPPQDIHSLALVAGAAAFRLYAEPAQRLATVQILSTTPGLQAAVQVEFVFGDPSPR